MPQTPPTQQQQRDPVTFKVNKLSSVKTQLPFNFYSLPYCRPDTIVQSAENLGEVLRGDRIENSLYQARTVRPFRRCCPAGGLGARQCCESVAKGAERRARGGAAAPLLASAMPTPCATKP